MRNPWRWLLLFWVVVILTACVTLTAHAQEITGAGQIDPQELGHYQAGASICGEYARLACEYASAYGYDCEQIAYAYISAGGTIRAHMLATWQQNGAYCYTSNNVLTCGLQYSDILQRDLGRKHGQRVCNFETRAGDNTNEFITEWCNG